MRRIAGVNTPSQCWARRNGACLYGRRRLGRKSIFQYFQTCWSMEDMSWIARHLKPRDESLCTGYEKAIWRRHGWVRGSGRNVLLCRVALRRIMDAFDVQWPSEIL